MIEALPCGCTSLVRDGFTLTGVDVHAGHVELLAWFEAVGVDTSHCSAARLGEGVLLAEVERHPGVCGDHFNTTVTTHAAPTLPPDWPIRRRFAGSLR